MQTLEESIATAMDVTEKDLLPFLPYILQDFWEIGANPDTIIGLIEKHANESKKLRILDAGCGKGAVSIKIADRLGHECFGVDAIPEFIIFARQKATELGLDHLCKFEVGDIRESVKTFTDIDLIVLGAIGQVFGDCHTTLTTITPCLNKDGLIIIDDAYIDDQSTFHHPQLITRKSLRDQIASAGMKLIDEITVQQNTIEYNQYDIEFENIKNRCNELVAQHPDKAHLFTNYIKNQQQEYDHLKQNVIGATMVIKRKTD